MLPTPPDSGEPLVQELERLAAEVANDHLRAAARSADQRHPLADAGHAARTGSDGACGGEPRRPARGRACPTLGGPADDARSGECADFGPRRSGGGLYSIAAVTGGSMFTIVMKADPAFARIDSELSGYYLLGVEADPSHRDGKPHGIKVDVDRGGVTVRSSRQLIVNRPPPTAARRPRKRSCRRSARRRRSPACRCVSRPSRCGQRAARTSS